jgi:hypothetical protein
MTRRALLGVTLALLASCGGSGDRAGSSAQTDAGGTASALPCDVAEVLAAHCQRCHGASASFGAPMSLTTLADVKANAARIKTRIHATDRTVMPPSPATMPKASLDALDAWLDAGAPAGAPGATCNDAGVPDERVGPAYLPCPPDEQVTFKAHGAAGAKYYVAPDAGNLNQCFTFKSPFDPGAQATAFAPIVDAAKVVHHYILFETSTPQVDGAFGACKMPLDATFVTGWAPGGKNNELPPDVGLRLPGKDKWLILQLHYWNTKGYADQYDASGVALCVAKTPRKNTAVISTLGTLGIDIPAKTMGVTASGTCTPATSEPVTVLAASPHMHGLGRKLKTEVLRGGDPTQSEVVVDVQNFDFNAQATYPLARPLVVMPGDKLKTTCVYDNPGNSAVYFGERTEDEMCFDFVLTYPEVGLATSAGALTRRCLGR